MGSSRPNSLGRQNQTKLANNQGGVRRAWGNCTYKRKFQKGSISKRITQNGVGEDIEEAGPMGHCFNSGNTLNFQLLSITTCQFTLIASWKNSTGTEIEIM